jgi:TRAP-type C4-dicarboxylate transport system permease small subunit
VLRPIDKAIHWLATINAPIARWGRSFAAVLLAIMLAVALAQILSRAIFNFTLDWGEDIARMSLVWSVLLTAPIGYRSGSHVAISAFVEALPPRWLYWIALLVNLLVGWICVMLLIESRALVMRGLSITAATVPIQMVWVYAIVPVVLTALILVALEMSLRLARALLTRQFDLMLSGVVPIIHGSAD